MLWRDIEEREAGAGLVKGPACQERVWTKKSH